MHPTFARAVGAASLALAAAGAHAGTLAMNGWLFGSGHTVNVSSPVYNGGAGGFSGTLSGMSQAAFNGSFELYCVDLAQTIQVPFLSGYSVKLDGEPGTAEFTVLSAASHFGGALAQRLAELVSHAEAVGTRVDTSAESTAMQLAVWNLVYDGDNTLSAGLFKEGTLSSYGSYANSLLTGSVGAAVTKDLYVLRSANKQDQLFWTPQRVPEPGTAALAALGLLGLALGRRRVSGSEPS